MSGSRPGDGDDHAGDGEGRAVRDARTRAAIEAYRRTLRNQSGPDGPDRDPGEAARSSAADERLLAERPPHWQTRRRT